MEFKETEGDPKGEAEEQVLVKKEFCRLLKGFVRIFPVTPEKPEVAEAKPIKPKA